MVNLKENYIPVWICADCADELLDLKRTNFLWTEQKSLFSGNYTTELVEPKVTPSL